MLCLLDKLFPALGTGDGDRALAFGYPDRLMALGAIEMPMLLILDPLQDHQVFPVFPIPLIGIAGQCAENGPNHQDIGQSGQQCGHHRYPHEKQRHYAQRHTGDQDRHIQFVCAVAAHHEPLNPHTNLTHENPLACFYTAIIPRNCDNATKTWDCLRIVQYYRLFPK